MTDRLNPMPMVDPVHRFVLFTNAKCGGTTLKAWFFDNLGLATLHRRPGQLLASFGPRYALSHMRRGRHLAAAVVRAPDGEAYNAALRDCITYYRHAFCARLMRSPDAARYLNLCVARDPYDRIVSAYLDKFCTFGGEGRDAAFVQRVLQESGHDDPSFRQFLDYLATADEASMNPHWRRQTYVIDGRKLDAVVRLEDLHDEMAQHAAVVGAEHLSVLRRKLQATRPAAVTITAEDLTGVPSLEIAARRAASGRFPPFASFLTPETRARIRSVYAADFERLPYPD